MKRPSVRALLLGCLLPSLVLAATPSTPPPVTNGVLGYYWDGTKLVAVTPGNPLPVNANVTVGATANVTATDCSGTISAGGSAQNAFAAQSTLHGFTIANIDSTSGSGEPIWISFTTTAAASTAASYPLAAPAATTFAGLSQFTAPPGFGLNHALSVIAVTTGHKYSCTWW